MNAAVVCLAFFTSGLSLALGIACITERSDWPTAAFEFIFSVGWLLIGVRWARVLR